MQKTFRGHNVQIIEERVSMSERDVNKYYYELRHDDYDWSRPATVELSVGCNSWGTMVSDTPIDLGKDDYLEIKEDESLLFVDAEE